ncbi:aldehyde dehydrogenase family protein, partial [Streptomyces sp. NPDC059851]|uniref:aldehyde dehydrogenase family protein n=1 Tax=Streptomyces sp. NPDC059851 TaxID=3346971 RepID=UPI0036519947
MSDALEVLNPATEETVAIVPAATRDDVDAAVTRAAASNPDSYSQHLPHQALLLRLCADVGETDVAAV